MWRHLPKRPNFHLAATFHDAVILDPKLPGGGNDWMRRCVPDGERRLIILTSGAFDGDVPARAILRKPIEINLLVETVASSVAQTD